MKTRSLARRIAVLFSAMTIVTLLYGCGQVAPTAVETNDFNLLGGGDGVGDGSGTGEGTDNPGWD